MHLSEGDLPDSRKRLPAAATAAPLTPTQRDLYLHHISRPDSTQHVIGDSCNIGPDIDADLWLQAAHTVLAEEPLARTRLTVSNREVLQEADLEAAAPPPTRIDFASNPDISTPEEFIERDRQRPMDLFALPLWRSYLIRGRDGTYTAGVTAPHIFTDGRTFQALHERIARVYETLVRTNGRIYEAPASAPTRSFLDYANALGTTSDSEPTLRFWSQRLAGLEPIGLAGTHQPAGRVREDVLVPKDELLAMRQFCRQNGWPFAALLRAVYALLLRRFLAAPGDIALIEILDTRPRDFGDGAGCFFQSLPILAEAEALNGTNAISELIAAMQRQREDALAHRDISSLALSRILSAQSLKCFFNFYAFETVAMLGKRRALHTYAAHGPDEIHLIPSLVPDGLRLKVDFPADRFPNAKFLQRFVAVLRQVTGGVSRLHELGTLLADETPVMGSAEAIDNAAAESPLLAFERNAAERPDAPAISFSGARITYAEVDQRANRLARHLAHRGARPGQFVAILLDRSLDLIVAMLAVLKTGAAYVPLDPASPSARLAEIVADSGATLLVTGGSVAPPPMDAAACAIVSIDRDAEAIRAAPAGAPFIEPDRNRAAYVIYTSGSTGKPKGVVVTLANVAALLLGAKAVFDFSADDVWTMFHSPAFDFSVWEIFGPLASGARLVIVPAETARSPEAFHQLLREEGVTVLNQTPSAFLALSQWEERVSGAGLASLRYVIFGGEGLRLEALRPWIARHGDASPALVNMYGITETTVHVTARRITSRDVEAAGGRSLIGRPLPGWTIALRDQDGTAVPPGLVGEIFVGGAGVARGYLNRPNLDAERFVTLGEWPNQRFYRSGDLARLVPDGDLEYLGRADAQVKIRGYRIEPGEIEAILLGQPGVAQAAVLAIDHAGDRRLVAYIVPAAGGDPKEAGLRASLSATLPDYMVPWRIIALPALPRTANGKLDRLALPDPGASEPLDRSYASPTTSTEAEMAGIWSAVLGISRVGIDDGFFELGGNSLLATQMILRVRERFAIPLPLHAAFRFTTVATLAGAVDKAFRDGTSPSEPAQTSHERPPARPPGPAPLTFAQERAWFVQQMEPGSVAYHFAATLAFNGKLDVAALSAALTALVQRHEVLRTTFESIDGSPQQRVHVPSPVALHAEPATAEVDAVVRAEATRPFDLGALPLVRWRLLRLGPERHVLVHVEHHLLHDGWSFVVLLRDLFALYDAFTSGKAPSLPVAAWQPSDVALRERAWMATEAAHRQLAFWTGRLSTIPKVLDLPTDRPRPAIETGQGDAVRLRLDDALAARLEAFSRERGVTPHTTLRAAFEALVHRLTGAERFLIGSGAANRGTPALESVVGMLLNNLALPADVTGAPGLETLVGRVRETAVAALDNQEVPFDHVVRALDPERASDRSPLCQVFFSSYDGPMPDFDLPGLEIAPTFGINNGSAKFDLNVIVVALPKGGGAGQPSRSIDMIWEYRTDLFLRETVERWSDWFTTLLAAALDAPSEPVGKLPLMSASDRELILFRWNQTKTDYPRDPTIHALFEEIARVTPDAPALVTEDGVIRYGELDRRADAFAQELTNRGIGRGARVGLCLKRSPAMIAAMLGTLKAGAVFVPLDPKDPPGRRKMLAEQAALDIILGEDGWDAPRDVGRSKAQGDRGAYIMFTSGSTGAAKGVLVSHRNVIRLVRGTDYASFGPDQVILQMAPLTFDASTFEIWGALLNGGALVLWPDREIDLAELGRVLAAHRVTTLWLTASLLHVVVRERLNALAGLRQLLAGGDVLQPADIARLREAYPRLRVVNGYGPTEGTTFSCCYTVPPGPLAEGSIPIGRPIANTTAYVLDGDMNPVPVGIPGELFIGGDGVALGYVNAPALTAERFLPDPWSTQGGRLYRTGDRVRWRPDGTLEFLGRMDRQVKVRGYRVEPAEVERAFAELDGVRDVAVTTPDDPAGGHRLHAYLATDGNPDVSEVRRELATRLPAHMIPSGFTLLDRLPMGPTGKIDRRSLPPPDPAAAKEDAAEIAPTTETERRLLAIWQGVLEAEGFGTAESFFDLGGHSLLALKLVHDINAAFSLELPVRFVINEPTIARQAALIDQLRLYAPPARSPAYPLVVPLQRGGSHKPFFLVAGGFGGEAELLVYARLADHLDRARPFYGLRIRGVDDLVEPGVSIEAIAAEHIVEIRRVQPKGPYFIGGSCVGGVVAFEIAQQLQQQGEEIAALILVDSTYPSRKWYWRYVARTFWRRFKADGLRALASAPDGAIEKRRFQIGRRYLARTLQYRPRPFAGCLSLIISERQRHRDPTRMWRALAAGGMELSYVPGDHFSHLRQYAAETGAAIDRYLAEAEEGRMTQ